MSTLRSEPRRSWAGCAALALLAAVLLSVGLVSTSALPAAAATVKTVRIEGEHGAWDSAVPERCPLSGNSAGSYFWESPFNVTNSYSNAGYVASSEDGVAGYVVCSFDVPYGKKVVSIDARFGEGPTAMNVKVNGGAAVPSETMFTTKAGEATEEDVWSASAPEHALRAGTHTIRFESFSRHVVLDFFAFELFTDEAPAPTTTTTQPPPPQPGVTDIGQKDTVGDGNTRGQLCTGADGLSSHGSAVRNAYAWRLRAASTDPALNTVSCPFTVPAGQAVANIDVSMWDIGSPANYNGATVQVNDGVPVDVLARPGSNATFRTLALTAGAGSHVLKIKSKPATNSTYTYADWFRVNLTNEAAPAKTGKECDDGFDNDYDGQIDFPGDAGCYGASDDTEAYVGSECDDGIDNDSDGYIDYIGRSGAAQPDSECASFTDDSEGPPPAGQPSEVKHVCSDGQDNDGDNLVDYPKDPGCLAWNDPSEWQEGDGGKPDYESPAGADPNCDVTWNPSSWGAIITCAIPALIREIFGLIKTLIGALWDVMRWVVDGIGALFIPSGNPFAGITTDANAAFPLVIAREVGGSVTTTATWFNAGLDSSVCGSFDFSTLAGGMPALKVKLPNPSTSACPQNSAATAAGEKEAGDLWGWRSELRMLLTVLMALAVSLRVLRSFAPKDVETEPAVPAP